MRNKAKDKILLKKELENLQISSKNEGFVTPISKPSHSLKDLSDLKDVDKIGKDIDYKQNGFCHHCKQNKSRVNLKRCNYNSSIMGLAIPTSKTINGTTMYNSNSLYS